MGNTATIEQMPQGSQIPQEGFVSVASATEQNENLTSPEIKPESTSGNLDKSTLIKEQQATQGSPQVLDDGEIPVNAPKVLSPAYGPPYSDNPYSQMVHAKQAGGRPE